MAFEAELSSPAIEEMMELKDLPESDRDEVRRFVEVLARLAAKKRGEVMPPAPEGMKEWIIGDDVENPLRSVKTT